MVFCNSSFRLRSSRVGTSLSFHPVKIYCALASSPALFWELGKLVNKTNSPWAPRLLVLVPRVFRATAGTGGSGVEEKGTLGSILEGPSLFSVTQYQPKLTHAWLIPVPKCPHSNDSKHVSSWALFTCYIIFFH